MNTNPDHSKMTEQERAEWHDARSSKARRGRAVKRQTRVTADSHLSVRLYADQISRLRQLADIESRSVSGLVREIVEEELNRRLPVHTPTENAITWHFSGPAVEFGGSAIPEDDIEREVLRIA